MDLLSAREERYDMEDLRAVAHEVRARRLALGMRTRRELAAASGVSDRSLSDLERAERLLGSSSRRMVEAALEWPEGRIQAIASGQHIGGGEIDGSMSDIARLRDLVADLDRVRATAADLLAERIAAATAGEGSEAGSAE